MRFTDREQIIKKYIINKDILDIGCVSNQKEGAFRFGRLHRFLVKHSNKVKGVFYTNNKTETLKGRIFRFLAIFKIMKSQLVFIAKKV